MKNNILLLILSIFISLLLGEGLVRVLESKKIIKIDRGILNALNMYVSPYVYVFKPYSSRIVPNIESQSYWQINGHGLRDVDYSFDKPNNTYRVAVIGDSITFGFGVDLFESYPKILEKDLNHLQDGKVNYEVMNFGKPGFGPIEYDEIWKNLASKFHPDLTIVGFYFGNDVIDAEGRFLEDKYISWHALPDRLVPYTVNEFLKNNSSLWLLILNKYYSWDKAKIYRADTMDIIMNGKADKERHYLMHVEPTDKIMEGWKISENAINSIVKKANESNTKVVILGLSAQEEILPDVWKGFVQKGWKADMRIYEDSAVRRTFFQLCEKNMWTCADTRGVLREQKDLPNLFIKLDSHFTYAGNKVVADYLMDFLINNKVIDYKKRSVN